MTDTVNDVWTPTEADREITSHKELVVDGKYRVRALFNGSPRFISEEAFTYNYPYEPELLKRWTYSPLSQNHSSVAAGTPTSGPTASLSPIRAGESV